MKPQSKKKLLSVSEIINREISKTLREAKIINEGDTSASTDAEAVLAILINNQDKNFKTYLEPPKDESAEFLVNYFKKFKLPGDMVDVYSNAAKQIKQHGVSGKASQLGSQHYPTTSEWVSYGGSKKLTSKTDVYATEGYSVKNASTQVRVLDASEPQLRALFMATINDPSLNINEQIKENIIKRLDSISKLVKSEGASISRYIAGKDKLSLEDLRNISKKTIKTIIDTYDQNTDQLNSQLNKIFDALTENSQFKYSFIYESITGQKAFGESQAAAKYILAWKKDFSDIKKLEMSDVANKIVSTFKVPQFASKTSGDRISKTAQLMFKSSEKESQNKEVPLAKILPDNPSEFTSFESAGYSTLKKCITESINITMEKLEKIELQRKKLLEQRKNGLITEGWLSDKIDYLKEKSVRFLLNMIKSIIEFISIAISKVKESIQSFMEFFGLKIDPASDYSVDASVTYDQL